MNEKKRHSDYSLLRDTSYFFKDLFGDFQLILWRNNRKKRAEEWNSHLEKVTELYSDYKGTRNTKKIEILTGHLSVLDSKFNGYLTFMGLIGGLATFYESHHDHSENKLLCKIKELTPSLNIDKISDMIWYYVDMKWYYVGLLPIILFIILFFISFILEPKSSLWEFLKTKNFSGKESNNSFCKFAINNIISKLIDSNTQGQSLWYYLWHTVNILIMYIFIRICLTKLYLTFFIWLVFSIILCFFGSQFLFWGDKSIGYVGDIHIRKMIRVLIYRTMAHRFAWISIFITLVLFFIIISPVFTDASNPYRHCPLHPYSSASSTEPHETLIDDICNVRREFKNNGISSALIVGRHDIRELSLTAKNQFDSNASLAQKRADNLRKLLGDNEKCGDLPPVKDVMTTASYPRNVFALKHCLAERDKELSEDRTCEIYGIVKEQTDGK